ncbi:uncharacterized protein LOC121904710 [Thunnus maccoyii]|uniref:uncharacterized protein LOC121904710 n=1 Tax=Thunnus maccoyii TaxID=8240 RepID=UPI001C4AB0CB|nr:uncharacterized protein LOC121904710 [Thunnus maccoyii]
MTMTMMMMMRAMLCVSLVCGLALDSNTIRSSKETLQSHERPVRPHGDPVDPAVQRQTEATFNANRRPTCSTPDCDASAVSDTQKGECSNRARRRQSSQDRQADRQADRQRDRETDSQSDTGSFNRTKAPEMSSCVRSGDCAAGLCCVRYLTGKRCQRIPEEGEACLLRGSKMRRNLGRCDCGEGLTCTAASRAELSKAKGQGVCLPNQEQGRTRHSGKTRRTAESSC